MKLKLLILFFSTFITTNSLAHKDIHIHKKYGNVKIYMKTGFYYSDVLKIQIIGKLSNELSKYLEYKDTILIEYLQDYTNWYKDDIYLLENNNSDYKFIQGIEKLNKKQNSSSKKGISIRICADRINIVETLKLIEYTIINRKKINKYLTSRKIRYNDTYFHKTHFITTGNSKQFIQKIFNKTTSELIKRLINRKIVAEAKKNKQVEIYWKNNQFIFEKKYIKELEKENIQLFKINDYFYHIYIDNGNRLLIFTDNTHFYYVDPYNKLIKQNEYKNGTYVPVGAIGKFGNKLIIHKLIGNSDMNIYLIKQNKMISKFE